MIYDYHIYYLKCTNHIPAIVFLICCFIWRQVWLQAFHYRPIHFKIVNTKTILATSTYYNIMMLFIKKLCLTCDIKQRLRLKLFARLLLRIKPLPSDLRSYKGAKCQKSVSMQKEWPVYFCKNWLRMTVVTCHVILKEIIKEIKQNQKFIINPILI